MFSGGTGGVTLHTNMELHVLPVQQAMLEAAGTISATRVGMRHICSFCHTWRLFIMIILKYFKNIVHNVPQHQLYFLATLPSLSYTKVHCFVSSIYSGNMSLDDFFFVSVWELWRSKLWFVKCIKIDIEKVCHANSLTFKQKIKK